MVPTPVNKASVRILLVAAVLFIAACLPSSAQFRKEAFTQSYNSDADSLSMSDSTDKMINFKEIFGGMAHKRDMRIGTMFGTSLFIPGTSQIYNKQYWKLPIVYGGIGAGLATGITYHFKYQQSGNQADKTAATWGFVAAGVTYYASLMDGAVSYKTDRNPFPGRATVYSILLPGLGQIYNGEYWKIPIYVGGIVGSVHFYAVNRTNYIRYRDIYREANEPGYTGPVSAEQAKYYRDEYRRYRDYSVVAIAAFYLLQVIDANVFCYMRDFDVSENIAMRVSPTVIMPEGNNCYAMMKPATGVSVGLRF